MKLLIVLFAWWFLFFGKDNNEKPVVVGPFETAFECYTVQGMLEEKQKRTGYWMSGCWRG